MKSQKKKKIVFSIPEMVAGGAERVITILSKEFLDEGIAVDILMLSGNRVQLPIDERVRVIEVKYNSDSLLSKWKAIRSYFKKEKQTYRIVSVPFLESCLKNTLAATLFLRIPVVASERNDPNFKGRKGLKKIKANIPFIISQKCVFQTPDAADYFYLVNRRKKMVIPNPIRVPSLKWEGCADGIRLISVCRIHPQKNLMMTIEVVSLLKNKYPNIVLDIFGEDEGRIQSSLEQVIEERGLSANIHFKGVSKEIQKEMSVSTLLISTSNYEGISNTMLEAMAIGLPMVCTDCPIGGAKMMLGDIPEMLSPIGNAEMFAQKVSYLLENRNLAMDFAKRAQNKALLYTPSKIKEAWLTVFENLW